jgi:enamine deaminase RidA (YjgF/YER057c/UK114 family)
MFKGCLPRKVGAIMLQSTHRHPMRGGTVSHRHLQPEGLAKPRGYSHVVAARGTQVFIAGQVAFDAEGRVVGAGDLRAQTEQVFENLQRALAAAGARIGSGQDHDLRRRLQFADRAVIAEASRFYGDASHPPAHWSCRRWWCPS